MFQPSAFRAYLRRTPFVARLLIVLAVLAYAWATHANLVSTSHNPASWPSHDDALLLAAQSDSHGHLHDEPTGGLGGGHQHGQHSADHNHDNPNVPHGEPHAAVKLPDTWASAIPVQAYPAPYFPFERPPNSLSMS